MHAGADETDHRRVNSPSRRTKPFQTHVGSVKSAREAPGTPISGDSLNRTEHSSQGEIVYDDKKQVKSGTLDGLIERLTTHDKPDPKFNEVFLLTFTSFTTADTLFNKLIERYITVWTLLTQLQYPPPEWTN